MKKLGSAARFLLCLVTLACACAPCRCPAQSAPARTDTGGQLTARFGGQQPRAWGVALPGVQSRLEVEPHVFTLALTLDACGGRGRYDADLIAFLRAEHIPATLFFTNGWIARNPDVFRELAADPLFEVAAHGVRHVPASVTGRSAYGIQGTRSVAELVREVADNVELIRATSGTRPVWFRSGTAFYDDVAVRVIQALGLRIAGYSLSGDDGARLSAKDVEKHVLAAKSGDIILCHMNHPESGTREGLKAALPQLLRKGAHFVRLSGK